MWQLQALQSYSLLARHIPLPARGQQPQQDRGGKGSEHFMGLAAASWIGKKTRGGLASGPRMLTPTAMWTPRRDVITASTEPLNRPTVNPIPGAVGPLAWHLMAPGDCTGKTWVQSVNFRAGCRGRTCGGRVSKQLTRTTRSASVRYTCNKRAYTGSISFHWHSTENR